MIRVDAASIVTIALAGALGYAVLTGGVILWKKFSAGKSS